MKKLVLMMVLFIACLSVKAADVVWSSQFTVAQNTGLLGAGGEADGDGAGWYAAAFYTADNSFISGDNTASIGWITGFGYGLDTTFVGPTTQGSSIYFTLFNNANMVSATYTISSANLTLPTGITTPPAPNSTDITFDFTGKTWQAVPEPATFLLFGIGGMGAWLIRRNKLQVKEEAEG